MHDGGGARRRRMMGASGGAGGAGKVGSRRPAGRALLVLAAVAVAAFIVSSRWVPDPSAIVVMNEGDSAVLVDLRSWGGVSGVGGPLARVIEPESSAVLYRPVGKGEVCLRVFEPASRQIATGLLPAAAGSRGGGGGDTVYLIAQNRERQQLRPLLPDPCPRHLAAHRVRIAPGRYFDPGMPNEIRRERLIRRFQGNEI